MGSDDESFDWDSDDEREIEGIGPNHASASAMAPARAIVIPREVSASASSSGCKVMDNFVAMGFPVEKVAEVIQEIGEDDTDSILAALLALPTTSSSASSSGSKSVDPYVGMGFDADLVAKVIQENGEENSDAILETLLAYKAIKESPEEQQGVDSDQLSSDFDESILDDFSDVDSCENEEMFNSELDEEGNTLRFLVKMGYSIEEASIALERCGPSAPIGELTDYLCAAQMAKANDALEVKPRTFKFDEDYPKNRKRSLYEYDMWKKRKQLKAVKKFLPEDEEILRLPNPMIGFGVPTETPVSIERNIPEAAKGPPYFYYENVALAPKGVWQSISRFLFDVEPEFVDSKYFCAAARKRGYVHNLPIKNRFPLLPLPPQTIAEALPLTKRWWPSWDPRTQLNCLQTCIASAKLTERIRKAVESCDDEPPMNVQKYVLHECRKWNLVWVGRNKVAPLEPDEVEMLLGFPRNHTRGGGISRTDRFKSLGNSFQVDTVAYHLSVLKDLFPRGMNVLSLFSGIGGAEVALHRLGIKLKTVVSVEISEVNRNIVRCWWEQTNQTGNLVDIADVQDLTAERLEDLMKAYGAFDLVVGGSPCNNLAGSNRHHRDGLEGKESSLFFDYVRILDLVKCMVSAKFSA